MAEEFMKCVEDGLQLSKRVYFGKDRAVTPPTVPSIEKASHHMLLPTAPMVYAVIYDPTIVDNPDFPSYQPHIYGRCDPPALIPLQMNKIEVEANCYLDTAFVTVSGSWRVHCVMRSRSSDCRLAVPIGEQGSILGVEVDVTKRSYCTQLITVEENMDVDKIAKSENGGFLKPQIFTLKIPEVDGGSDIKVKVSWSQKLLYNDEQFFLTIPFSFPEYVTPSGMIISKHEKIELNVNYGHGIEVLCNTGSHFLKEIRRQAGNLGFSYEAEVLTWSTTDFSFSYKIFSSDIFGGLLLQSPSVHDFDQREMFGFYLFPGNNQHRKVFRKEVVFVVDISGSMRGRPIENVKNALSAALSKLDPVDSFNIIAFNGETYLFSASLQMATKEVVENASKWISINFIAGSGTNIFLPLNQAIEMLSNTSNSMPLIFLITDGAVEDERQICNVLKSKLTERGAMSPRISTFGIGSFCNHYFLQMLAVTGRGQYDAAYDIDSIDVRMERLFTTASSAILANITIDMLEQLDVLEVYPFHIPDLSSGRPLMVSGRYKGNFPVSVKARGILADMSNFSVDLKVQKAKDIPIDKVFAKQQIDLLTTQAWLLESKEMEKKIAKMSIQNATPSEYTCMVLIQTEKGKEAFESVGKQKALDKIDLQKVKNLEGHEIMLLRSLGVGFGNLIATTENIPPGSEEAELLESASSFIKAASTCCGWLGDCCCCMCCIRICSRMNDQCAIAFTQLISALACFGCLSCCSELCCSCGD